MKNTKPEDIKLDNNCPHCGFYTDCVSEPSGTQHAPCQGDLSICYFCSEPAQFDAQLKLIKLPDDKLEDIKTHHPEVFAQLEKLRSAISAERKQASW